MKAKLILLFMIAVAVIIGVLTSEVSACAIQL